MQVQPSGRPGVYLVAGNTNLPDQSRITVTATRSLDSGVPPSTSSNPNTTYSILDRQIAKVERGNWQTTLNLWQIASDGRFREAWQLNQPELGLSITPASEVTFLALVDPVGQSPVVKQQLEQLGKKLEGSLVRFTSDGQWYLQTREILALALPTGKTTPPILRAEDRNGGWGDRFAIKQQSKSSDFVNLPPAPASQTDQPLSSSEFLR